MRKPLLALPLAALALSAIPLLADEHDKKTDVTITEPVQIPGGTVLAPGTYMFILNNSSSTRNIVEIKSEDGKHLYGMMFTTRANHVQRKGKTILTFYEMPAGQPQAVRQWFWPGDYDGQEFLYPSSEAAVIQKTNSEKVPEVSDHEYSELRDRGFSTSYPVNTSESSVQSPTAIPNSGQQLNPEGTHAVGDPGATGQNNQALPPAR